MDTKTSYSHRNKEKDIDPETGEELMRTSSEWADKNFHKIFIKNFHTTLKGVMGQKMQVVLWLLENMTAKNEIRHTYKEIAERSGVSLQTVVRTIEILDKSNFLCREKYWLRVNPDVAFRGRFESRASVVLDYKMARRANSAAVPDTKEREELMKCLEKKEHELEVALEQVKKLEKEKRKIEKKLTLRRKTGPKPKDEKKES